MKLGFLPEGTIKRFKKNKKGMLGLYMLLAAFLIAAMAPVLTMYDPFTYYSELEYVAHPPTWKYLLGTDLLGSDVYSQVIWGFRTAFKIGIPSAFLVGIIGTVVGLVSGYYGGYVDKVLQRISITFLVWPSIPLVALIVHSWGGYQAQIAIILGVSFTLWPTSARAIRAQVMSLKTRSFIEAAQVSGATSRRIIFRHIFPNVVHLTFLYMTIAVASALVLEATINFLGMGDASIVTWGRMLAFTLTMQSGYAPWWTIVPPGAAITYMVLSLFLISMGLRESMRVTLVRF
jgi:peptide/nickel transport system permease protein